VKGLIVKQHSSKSSAIRAAKAARAKGQAVKVFHHAGVYTQPFKGIAAYSYYVVQAV